MIRRTIATALLSWAAPVLPVAAAEACAPDLAAAEATGAGCVGPVRYACPGGPVGSLSATFHVDPGRESVVVTAGDARHAAPLVRSASGARYAGEDGFAFWTKGQEATVRLPDSASFACRAASGAD